MPKVEPMKKRKGRGGNRPFLTAFVLARWREKRERSGHLRSGQKAALSPYQLMQRVGKKKRNWLTSEILRRRGKGRRYFKP